jgi:hypothetical protein
LTFEPLPVFIIENATARGGNSLGLKQSDGPLVVVLLYTSWDSSVDDEKVYSANRNARESIDKESLEKNVSASYRYMNYAFPNQDPIKSYGPENQHHLQKVSKKYDPDGFFQKAIAGPFKLW